MEIQLNHKEEIIVNKIADAAQELGLESYLIGGFVRDKILGRPTTDADIVCLGDGIELAKAVANKFTKVPEVNFFKNFGTAHIHTNDFDIEFVGARKKATQGIVASPK